MDTLIESKVQRLRKKIRSMNSALIALSGGVDSSFLLAIAATIPRIEIHAATIVSPAHPPWELDRSIQLAKDYGVQHHLIEMNELMNASIVENGPDRCYHCKLGRYHCLKNLGKSLHLSRVLDGTNADDLKEIRPGLRAIRKLKIGTPLADCGFTKIEIRTAARELGLSSWDIPATSCLFTRIPTGEPLDENRIRRICLSEKAILDAGFAAVRVRDHGSIARIELPPADIIRIVSSTELFGILGELRSAGYQRITVDLEGYTKTGETD